MSEEFNPGQHMIQVQGGANYLPVAPRIQWLRKENKVASILTEIVQMDDKTVTFKATVELENGSTANGHAREVMSGGAGAARFNPLETCETSAIGRALAALGYGTLDAIGDDAATGSRIVDSPVSRPKSNPAGEPASDAQIKLVKKMLSEAGVPSGYLEGKYPEGMTKAQASEVIKSIKDGKIKGEEGGEAALDPDAKPKSDVTRFWERAKEINLNTMQDVKAYLGDGLVESAGGDFKKLLKLVNDKHTSEELGVPF